MTFKTVPVKSHWCPRETQIYLRDEKRMLPAGAYVKVIDPIYLPRDHGLRFSGIDDTVVYTQFGLGVVSGADVEIETG